MQASMPAEGHYAGLGAFLQDEGMTNLGALLFEKITLHEMQTLLASHRRLHSCHISTVGTRVHTGHSRPQDALWVCLSVFCGHCPGPSLCCLT